MDYVFNVNDVKDRWDLFAIICGSVGVPLLICYLGYKIDSKLRQLAHRQAEEQLLNQSSALILECCKLLSAGNHRSYAIASSILGAIDGASSSRAKSIGVCVKRIRRHMALSLPARIVLADDVLKLTGDMSDIVICVDSSSQWSLGAMKAGAVYTYKGEARESVDLVLAIPIADLTIAMPIEETVDVGGGRLRATTSCDSSNRRNVNAGGEFVSSGVALYLQMVRQNGESVIRVETSQVTRVRHAGGYCADVGKDDPFVGSCRSATMTGGNVIAGGVFASSDGYRGLIMWIDEKAQCDIEHAFD